ncbi:MAG TPA: ribonuclease domain-containing protein [Nocardioides sp.]|nr:ribonuclease domain-containing protein [Nocardioides sp.]
MSRRTARLVSALLVALLAVATWWLQDRGGDDDPAASGRPSPSYSTGRGDAPAHRGGMPAKDGLPSVDLADLPAEAAETVELIDAGGPFRYPGKDGSTFGNFEGVLPQRPRGYYAEYTVPTPGEDDRGARRIIAGDGGELYWTEDHYASFARIRR